MIKTKFDFPYGYREFHQDKGLNYQLNRFYSMGLTSYEEMKEAGEKIKTCNDWADVMRTLAEKAVSENRMMNAAFCYRAAEFYLLKDNPDKAEFYRKFQECFSLATQGDEINRFEIPYENGMLSTIQVPASQKNKEGVVVVHGGNDSFIEEFYPLIRYFSDNGYDVIGFDGPGQGASLKKYDLPLDPQWEKPVGTILDYFEINDVTLVGISMGGWLCLRAAACEPRVKRVVAWSASYDVTRYTNAIGRVMVGVLMKRFRNFVGKQMRKNMNKSPEYSWFMNNLMYITRKSEPIEAIDVLMQFNRENLQSESITQDVLILTGKDDHLVPYKMHDMQVKALINARSVTSKIFTVDEQAQNHCQMGNLQLACDTIAEWLKKVDPR